MSLQNRVDPWGKLNAVSMRGSLMGNRGILHNESRQIVRPWAGKSWVTCALQFNDVHRLVFDKGTYSELFFLDEATAFAAGLGVMRDLAPAEGHRDVGAHRRPGGLWPAVVAASARRPGLCTRHPPLLWTRLWATPGITVAGLAFVRSGLECFNFRQRFFLVDQALATK